MQMTRPKTAAIGSGEDQRLRWMDGWMDARSFSESSFSHEVRKQEAPNGFSHWCDSFLCDDFATTCNDPDGDPIGSRPQSALLSIDRRYPIAFENGLFPAVTSNLLTSSGGIGMSGH